MVIIPNTKDIRVGDNVSVRPRLAKRIRYEGQVVWVHPTKGWGTVRLVRSAEKQESNKPGVYVVVKKEFVSPYNSSFDLAEMEHLDDVSGREPLEPRMEPMYTPAQAMQSTAQFVGLDEDWDDEDDDECEDPDITITTESSNAAVLALLERLQLEALEKEDEMRKAIAAQRFKSKPVTYAIIYEDGRGTTVQETKTTEGEPVKRTFEDLQQWMRDVRQTLGLVPRVRV